MKPVYTLSGRDLSMIKYNDFINKKAPELCDVRRYKNLVKHINYLMRQYWHK